jgi:hypothetical protein
MQVIKNCSNYVYEHARPVFTASAVICTRVGIKTWITPQGSPQATFKAVPKTSLQCKMKKSFLLLISVLGTITIEFLKYCLKFLEMVFWLDLVESITDRHRH